MFWQGGGFIVAELGVVKRLLGNEEGASQVFVME